MGCIPEITATKFPTQGKYLDMSVVVSFHYNMSELLNGVIVRDDMAEPFVMIIRLEDGRHVLATECQYRLGKRET